ncbi:MAG: CopG family transcriptional regulator [Parasporobacterium sp.]|nr:CopG family transcriptional regulator [Parasporobacterium sp.]
MKEPKLILTPKKYTGETAIISMRIPKDMLKDIDAAASASGRNRNELLTIALEFALKHMEIVDDNKEE